MTKRKLTTEQEFEIMKIVLDKFLLLGFGILAYGLYQISKNSPLDGFYILFGGAAVLVIFTLIIIKEFEVISSKVVDESKKPKNGKR